MFETMTDLGQTRCASAVALPGSVDEVKATDPFALAAALAPLTERAIEALDATAAEVVVAATQRVVNALAARQAKAVEVFTERVAVEAEHERLSEQARWEALREAARAHGRPVPARTLVPVPCVQSLAGAMLAPILRIAPRTMVSRIDAAQWLGVLPRSRAMAWAGDLEPYRWAHLARAAEQVGIDHVVELEARVHHAGVTELASSRVKARCLAAVAAMGGADSDDTTSAARRFVRVEPASEPGLTQWTALLPAEASRLMWSAIDALGAEYLAADPTRTPTQTRADAFCDLVLAHASVRTECVLVVPAADFQPSPQRLGMPPTAGPSMGTRPGTRFGVPAVRIWDADEAGAPTDRAGGVGELEVPSEPVEIAGMLEDVLDAEIDHARRVDANPRLRRSDDGTVWFVPGPVATPKAGWLLPEQVTRILADPDTSMRLATACPQTGAVHLVDATAYRPGRQLARAVRRRDGTCRFPGCATPAERCDLDHVVPHPLGPTTSANLVSLCRTHHGFKHHAGWTLELSDEGACTWRAPHGRTHTTLPDSVLDPAAA